MKKVTLFLLKIYKLIISPFLQVFFGKACRFTPTCSVYAYRSIERLGLLRGGKIAIKRIVSCHPFSGEIVNDSFMGVEKKL